MEILLVFQSYVCVVPILYKNIKTAAYKYNKTDKLGRRKHMLIEEGAPVILSHIFYKIPERYIKHKINQERIINFFKGKNEKHDECKRGFV